MPQKILKFTGINRRTNEFNSIGACEELVNLRPDADGGVRVVRPKKVIAVAQPYVSLYEHAWGDKTHLIGVTADGRLKMIRDNDVPIPLAEAFTTGNVTLCHAGNVLVAYNADDDRQIVLRYEDDHYSSVDLSFKEIADVEVSYNYSWWNPQKNASVLEDTYPATVNEYLQKTASGFYEKYPNGLCGVSVIGCTYELKDGTEVWSTAFIVADITGVGEEPKFYSGTDNTQIIVYGSNEVTLSVSLKGKSSGDIKCINVYASRPIFPYEKADPEPTSYALRKMSLDELNLDGQLMYFQGSISQDESEATIRLNFSQSLAGERVMEVNNGILTRTGEVISYNNRFHYYKSKAVHVIQKPTVCRGSRADAESTWVAYVKFDKEWKLIDQTYGFNEGENIHVVYPMAGIKRIAFVKADTSGEGMTVPFSEGFYVDLKDSSAYNYSYAFDVTVENVGEMDGLLDTVTETGQLWGNGFDSKVLWKNETNVVNVSYAMNPYVFPVKYSYSFGGNILGIETSYLPISSTQIEQFPLTVFTSNGIFAFQQGSGGTLYGNIVPLQPLVLSGKTLATPLGILFVASKTLYLLSGREAVNLSKPLMGPVEQSLKDNPQYRSLCFADSEENFDFSTLLSKDEFENVVSDSDLAYDPLQNEVYISGGTDTNYSYVFSLDTNLFHKRVGRYVQKMSGARKVIMADDESNNIVDMYEEPKRQMPVLLQSRPLRLEEFYTHIQRLILLTDANLTGDDFLMFSVFGSDNLSDWKCIISAQKADAVIRQIRTNKAAKSYREYIVLINGMVGTDTDISEIIADYTLVNRRLG